MSDLNGSIPKRPENRVGVIYKHDYYDVNIKSCFVIGNWIFDSISFSKYGGNFSSKG